MKAMKSLCLIGVLSLCGIATAPVSLAQGNPAQAQSLGTAPLFDPFTGFIPIGTTFPPAATSSAYESSVPALNSQTSEIALPWLFFHWSASPYQPVARIEPVSTERISSGDPLGGGFVFD